MANFSEAQQAVLTAFNLLPLKERKDTNLHAALRMAGDKAYQEWYRSEEYKEEQEANERKNEERRKREFERGKEAAKEAMTLEPGTLIKVKGTRDGHGVREVIKVDRYQLVCWKMQKRYRGGWERTTETTTHGLEKFVKVLTFNDIR